MIWSAQQDGALRQVAAWLKAGEPQIFRLFGYAGTGKSTLAKHVADAIEGDVVFGAFTGKAALVMRRKGCRNAATIHSLIYEARETEAEMPTFMLDRDSVVGRAELVIIDECSMVDADLGRDLLSFDTPILVLGDPGQLPPISGAGYFTEAQPDVLLTDVHRQAADNPIIRLSMSVRAGGRLAYGTHGDSRVIRREELGATTALTADQILVGTNKTRRAHNARIRALKRFDEPLPVIGDKLVCLRNDATKGLLNGSLWNVDAVRPRRKGHVRLTVRDDEGSGRSVKVSVLEGFFGSEAEIPYALRQESDEFDYGYALTVHKSQGSQWDNVVLFDESWAFREHRARWLYTGLTRAAERITVVA